MKTLRILGLVLMVLFVIGGPVLAQTDLTPAQQFELAKLKEIPKGNFTLSGPALGAGLGAALTLIGAGWGFGRIGAAALESMARQPEVAPRIQTAMIVIAALLEGATFFALIVCIIASTAKF
jgi:F-type H+-transporting ATPase subunit c